MRWFLPLLIVLGIGAGIIVFNVESVRTPPERTPGTPSPANPSPSSATSDIPRTSSPARTASTLKSRKRYVLFFAVKGDRGLRLEPRDLPPAPHTPGIHTLGPGGIDPGLPNGAGRDAAPYIQSLGNIFGRSRNGLRGLQQGYIHRSSRRRMDGIRDRRFGCANADVQFRIGPKGGIPDRRQNRGDTDRAHRHSETAQPSRYEFLPSGRRAIAIFRKRETGS